MRQRKVHLRTQGVVQLGHSRTYCGRVIYSAPRDMTGMIVTFNNNLDATVHGALVTCEWCLAGTHHQPEAA